MDRDTRATKRSALEVAGQAWLDAEYAIRKLEDKTISAVAPEEQHESLAGAHHDAQVSCCEAWDRYRDLRDAEVAGG